MKYLILLCALALTACKAAEGETTTHDSLLGVALSHTECRQVSTEPIELWALSGQIYGVHVYDSETICQVNGATWLDMGGAPHIDSAFDDNGYPDLVLKLSLVNSIYYLDVYEED